MMLKRIITVAFLTGITFNLQAQRMKVKRKGVTPVDVSHYSKISTANSSAYSLNQLTGKWQEVSRRANQNPVSFKDTLFYNFSQKGEVYTRDGVNMSLMGEAAIDPGNVLVAAADVFTIKALNNNQLVLDDGDFIHTLVKKNNFWYESLPTNAIVPEKYITPVSVNISALSGKWKVYRREAQPGIKDKVLIRILNIKNIQNDNSATGEITFYNSEKLETLPGAIKLSGENLHIATEKNTWNMKVYKANGNDLVFGDGNLMYYCKPL